jgi:thiamine kinase
MADTIPPDIRLRVEQTLAQWRAWNCQPKLKGPPSVLKALTGGLSNYSALVGGERKYVVRIDGRQVRANHLSRAAEWRVLHSAHEALIAPCPRYYNPDLGAMVCDYHEPVMENGPAITKIATLLRDIHALPPVHYKLDLKERIGAYEHQLGDQKTRQLSQSLRQKALSALELLSQEPENVVLCHNDLLAANRLDTALGLLAIDWEYCAMGSPWFDLAVIVIGDKMSEAQREALVLAYLQRPATTAEQLLLERYCEVYRYLEQLWGLTNDAAALNL